MPNLYPPKPPPQRLQKHSQQRSQKPNSRIKIIPLRRPTTPLQNHPLPSNPPPNAPSPRDFPLRRPPLRPHPHHHLSLPHLVTNPAHRHLHRSLLPPIPTMHHLPSPPSSAKSGIWAACTPCAKLVTSLSKSLCAPGSTVIVILEATNRYHKHCLH